MFANIFDTSFVRFLILLPQLWRFAKKFLLKKEKNYLSYFGFYIANVVTNGKLVVFLLLFYGKFVLVFGDIEFEKLELQP